MSLLPPLGSQTLNSNESTFTTIHFSNIHAKGDPGCWELNQGLDCAGEVCTTVT